MARLSMGDVWEEARGFIVREAGLLVPLALATIGLGLMLSSFTIPAPVEGQNPAPGAWMLGLVPALLAVLIGNLSLSALVLRRGSSVAEALAVAFRRLPAALLATALMGLAATIAMTLVLAATLVAGLPQQRSLSLAITLAIPLFLWASVRLLPLMAALVDGGEGPNPVPPLRRAFALTRGRAVPILGTLLLYSLVYLILWTALQFALGSVLLLVARIAGRPELGALLTVVIVGLVLALVQAGWVVFAATLYRRLAASSGR